MGSALKVVFDTNILIDYLSGINAAKSEIERYGNPAISLVTWIEVLVGAANDEEERTLRGFLTRFELAPITLAIADRAARLRRDHKIRLPDAIIWATAQERECLLVTRDTRDFSPEYAGIRVPYTLSSS